MISIFSDGSGFVGIRTGDLGHYGCYHSGLWNSINDSLERLVAEQVIINKGNIYHLDMI